MFLMMSTACWLPNGLRDFMGVWFDRMTSLNFRLELQFKKILST